MKKLFALLLLPALLLTFTFAQTTDVNSVDVAATDKAMMKKHERVKRWKADGASCGEIRDTAREELDPLRDEMKANWETFRAEYGSIKQYFVDLSDEDMEAVKELLGNARGDIKEMKKGAREEFKKSFDSGIIDEIGGEIIKLQEEKFSELRNYVTIDAHGFDEWVDGFLAVKETNKELKEDIVATKTDYRKECYDEKSQKTYDKVDSFVTELAEKWDSEKVLEKFPQFLERLENMMEKTNDSSVPDEQKETRIELIQMLYDTIQDIIDELQS